MDSLTPSESACPEVSLFRPVTGLTSCSVGVCAPEGV